MASVGKLLFTRLNWGNAYRRFSTSAIKRSEIHQHGIPGANLPIDISNRYKLTAIFTIFFCSGFSLPFIVVRHQILKKNL
ncbi:hypothetical protein ACJMK2_027160 [Sinanodonta woodiana]|uniref:Cytochrome c oxidase subunit 7C, mitochondrial n=1 Tax=Sinanodonta woodiana TaxID=1069815 RepID=A0ABD3XLZ0_SINWO